jgi:hypothetical protein
MKHVRQILLIAIFLVFEFALGSQSSQTGHLHRHWKETATETLWRVRYSNCDYGYFVLLGAGVIAHGSHSPAPNHGFLISLPDVERTTSASGDEDRYVWVDASYNVGERRSLAGVVSERTGFLVGNGQKSQIAERTAANLAGLRAIKTRIGFQAKDGPVVEETVIALRAGTVYTVGLRTFESNRSDDEKEFQKVLAGFHLLKVRDATTDSYYCPD